MVGNLLATIRCLLHLLPTHACAKSPGEHQSQVDPRDIIVTLPSAQTYVLLILSSPKQQRLDQWRKLRVAQELRQYIRWVLGSSNVIEVQNPCRNRLAHSMISQCIVPFRKH